MILLSTIVDFNAGLKIYQSKSHIKKYRYLLFSIIFNIGLLGFFKYFNFFIESWSSLSRSIGISNNNFNTINIILPVGISFYTFQTMSYSLDIYYNKMKPTKDFITFASFVSFFTQLVAGPIERASHFLPQILKSRVFNYRQGVQGLRLILWGLFKKVIIADNLALRVDMIFNGLDIYNGGVLLLGLVYFSFQIYCDFSGYSDIAIGSAKLFGIELSSNFRLPYFSRSISEFWNRWHISLSSWFRDYLYIPIGGSKVNVIISLRNILVIFILSGFWHGANWTFMFWGFFHAILYIPIFLFKKNRLYENSTIAQNSFLPSFKETLQVISTFFLVTLSWVFFRSPSISYSFKYLNKIFSDFAFPDVLLSGLIFVIIMIIGDWVWRYDERSPLSFKSLIFRRLSYILITIFIIGFSIGIGQDFIYFQF